ncbi:MAG TPA: 16S rRNA (guanine(966)-N(2))-methyltransferase RsmD [Nocardioides sp.]|nr:16S rRNA (guanine(966)-N(2))-methyltransferase RsmD [Nocardioides sp.]
MTRIIGGSAGGRRIETPRGDATRPTSDRVREALFSTLEAWFEGSLSRISVLDLYAGSGAIGLEAASRGASQVVAVESDRSTAQLVQRNARALGPTGAVVEVAAQPVARFLAQPARAQADLVFLDPPYPLTEDDLATDLRLLVEHGWLAEDALVVVERSRRSPEPTWPDGLEPLSGKRGMKKYGETTLWFSHH